MDAGDDELIQLLEEPVQEPSPAAPRGKQPWSVLIIDDDPEVHSATAFALRGVDILGRQIALQHAMSGADARALLAQRQDFAVILLDVVMETADAGLQLVGYIRETLGMAEVRIILRTGQPGYAPELSVFNNYDINDYRTKSELSRTRLITSLMAALRSYQQLRTIAEGRSGLVNIVQATAQLMTQQSLGGFAASVLEQLVRLLGQTGDGLLCLAGGVPEPDGADEQLRVLAASGELAQWQGRALSALPAATPAVREVLACLEKQAAVFASDHLALYLASGQRRGAVYLRLDKALNDVARQMLGVFAANITACLGNVGLLADLHYTAYHDGLTRFANRTRFILDLNEVARLDHADLCVVLLDIEHFADLNDGLGHDAGNALLLAVAARLRDTLGEHCRLARIGADVFGIIGPEAQVNPDSLQRLFSQPFAVDEHVLPISVCMGFCRLLERKASGLALLKRANIALNRAKHNVRASYEYFLPEMEDGTRWRLETIRHLRQDFLAGRLALWFQPQIELASGRLVGVEALLRWPGHEGFVQPPNVFIPLAEYSGLIIDIGAWVLDQACASFKQLRDLPAGPRYVAVNVSMPQLRGGRFPGLVAEVLARHQLPPGSLELEVTESLAMDEPKTVVGSLEALKAVGARLAIDDFGTGYSSLGHLRQLPISCLKIDQSFVREIEDGKGGMFVETIVALSRKLGVQTVAEGVETKEQAAFLRALGCTYGQGYLYAKPMPLEQLVAWISRQPGHP